MYNNPGPYRDFPPRIRESALIKALEEKARATQPGTFDFDRALVDLRFTVALEMDRIVVLFPEYTPHDEKNHVSNLFELEDKLFGPTLYNSLNVAELFVLASALYTHDWGMSVNADERKYILQGANPDDLTGTFAPLEDERERISSFQNDNDPSVIADRSSYALSESLFPNYIRDTHALRSEARVKSHFKEHIDVANAISQVSRGHTCEFRVLDNQRRFRHNLTVCGYNVNLLAITLNIRIVDLFDLTGKRTPYALWRFVSPLNPVSAMEWEKHRSLTNVSAEEFPPGRAIKVEGMANKAEIWSALEDLRIYCEGEIRETHEIAARHIRSEYKLDFIKLIWDIQTGDLCPISIRFTFDQTAVFAMLSRDIYSADCYVFLRELLQNSIDAIRTRLALDRQDTHPAKISNSETFDTTIWFRAKHESNGDIEFSCTDRGIGMDEYIVRNYFAKAGVSYYRSPDFQKQRLQFEPISRFGIGILSCFMVSKALKVITRRSLDACTSAVDCMSQNAIGIEITIPDVMRQFVVKEAAKGTHVGTTISLTVSRERIQTISTDSAARLDAIYPVLETGTFKRTLLITEYLKRIAGFVEFPIVIEEMWPEQTQPHRTLILNPDVASHVERDKFSYPIDVCQLNDRYPWTDAAEEEFSDLISTEMDAEVVKLSGHDESEYRGWIIFPKMKRGEWDYSQTEYVEGINESGNQIVFRSRTNLETVAKIVWKAPQGYGRQATNEPHKWISVYRDGILVEGISTPHFINGSAGCLPLPVMRVNLPSTSSLNLNLPRTGLAKYGEKWDEPVWQAVKDRFRQRRLQLKNALDLGKCFYELGNLAAIYEFRDGSFMKSYRGLNLYCRGLNLPEK